MAAIDLSFLPKDTTFWIVVAGCLAVVIILAIVFGRGLNFGPFKLDRGPEKKPTKISVGERLEGKGLKVGGDIAGVKQSGTTSNQDVDVLRGGKLTDAEIRGDITGYKQEDDGKK